MRKLVAGVVAALVLTVPAVTVAPDTAPAEAATATTYVRTTLRAAVKALPVRAESNSGYDRDRYFGRWKDANGDCQDTRHEVLIQESTATVRFSSSSGGCRAKTGRWVSMYDGKAFTSAADVQVDHLVPVHEAWGSGAKGWTKSRRVAFYNDLGDKRALNAVSASSNQSKGARDPAEWLPGTKKCGYVKRWVAVKSRWKLTVDSREKDALTRLANGCTNADLNYYRVN
jgi:hypothetical protein